MKIGIYNPYLDTTGGGEKYILSIAEVLSNEQVFILLDDHLQAIGIDKIKQKIKSLHGLDLSKIKFISAPIGPETSIIQRLFFMKQFDWFFYLTDGSVFYSTARNNVIHFQVPYKNTTNSLVGKLKLSSWDLGICNSKFTKNIIDQTWPIKTTVLYPPVSVDRFKPMSKKKQILNVGRFFGFLKDKKQGLLIDVFKQLESTGELKNWSLHLAGSAGEGDKKYVNELIKQAKGSKIYFYPNTPLLELARLYGEATIYWHAMGYEEEDPKKMEHFGITTVEAMSAGCVPIVINKGGQVEIVENGESGLLWDDLDQLKNLTKKVIKDPALTKKLAENAQKRSQLFGKENFARQIKEIVYGKK